MNSVRNIYISITTCLLALLVVNNAQAQDAVFAASASAAKIGIEDQVQIQYMIKDVPNIRTLSPDPKIKENFFIVGGPFQSQGTQMTVVNGQMTQSQSLTITYVLQPKRKGKLVIPAATAKDGNGDEYESNSVPIEVVDGSLAQPRQSRRSDPFGNDPFDALLRQRRRQMQAQRQQRQQENPQSEPEEAKVDLEKDLYIKVVVDKSKVHVGEQITALYKLYARLPMNVSISKLPTLNGFWTQDFEIPKKITPKEEIIDGQRYQVFTLKKSALFPQQTGTLELDPAEAEGVARIMQKVRGQRDPFFDDPFFNSFFMDDPFADEFFGRTAYKDIRVKLKSKPVKIQVDALPEDGKPESFTGAVGDFSITGTLDKNEITTDGVANLTLEIKGSGNIKLIEPPILKLPNGLIAYDPVITDTITGRTTTISGTKTITYSITPRTPGEYNLEPVEFSYFNPQSGQYITLKTDGAKLKVTPGENYSPDAPSTALTDIHNITTTPLKKLSFNSRPIIFSAGYWSLYALPALAFIGIILWRRREEELSKDTVLLRNKRANKIALKRLTTAKKLLEKNERVPFYEEISKAIWLYLSDKLNIPLSSLSKDNVWDALNNRNVDKNVQQELEKVMTECETALYAGVGGSQQMNQTYTDAVEVISKLEESFKG